MINRSDSLPYRSESNTRVIHAGTSIRDILEISIADDSWQAVAVPEGISCKAILATTRDGGDWKISHLVAGARYLTVKAPLSIDIAGLSEEILFYAQSSSGNKTLEVLFLD